MNTKATMAAVCAALVIGAAGGYALAPTVQTAAEVRAELEAQGVTDTADAGDVSDAPATEAETNARADTAAPADSQFGKAVSVTRDVIGEFADDTPIDEKEILEAAKVDAVMGHLHRATEKAKRLREQYAQRERNTDNEGVTQ